MGIQVDLKDLCDLAVESGATRATAIEADKIVVDERVQLKCRYPPCEFYGRNHMCPPFTPTAREFLEYLSKYRYGILIQIEAPITDEVRANIQRPDAKLSELMMNKSIRRAVKERLTRFFPIWKKLLNIISRVEGKAFKRGYYLSLGLSAGTCPLCDVCDPKQPCKHPFEARPSMEAVGIDVYKTAKNVGLEFPWSTKEKVVCTGLVLIE